METYYFVFTIHNYDDSGQEHRLTARPYCIKPGDGLIQAVKDLVRFAAKMLRCDADHVAAKRIMLKSAWCQSGKKRTRVTTKQLLEALLKAGFAPKGRQEQHITETPRKPYTHKRR